MIRYLSHKLSASIPVYGSTKATIQLREIKSIVSGDSCQTYWLGMENHWGTHVDCPAHFFTEGMKIADYEAKFWLFRKPQILSVNAKPGQIIGRKDLITEINPETDLLLLKSGWGKFRGEEIYSLQNPGLDPGLGLWLRKEYPSLRAIGFDWISLSSYTHRELGREAHKAFLNPEGVGHPIVIIEDMNISEYLNKLKEVWVVPLRVERIDSVPCTASGVFE